MSGTIKKEQYAEALRICCGVKSRAADLLGVSRGTLTNICRKWPELQEICDSFIWRMLDGVQYGLLKKVERGDLEAFKLVLKYYGHLAGLVPDREEPSDKDDEIKKLKAAVALLLHKPAALSLLKQYYIELNNADSTRFIDAEFSRVGTDRTNTDNG